jgi:hypothetical protein
MTSHTSEGAAALGQVHDHQPDEEKADVGVDSDPDVQKLQCAECGRRRAQETEVDRPTGEGAERYPAVGRPLERRPSLRLERCIRHPAPASVRE